jgi:hypothetical protein
MRLRIPIGLVEQPGEGRFAGPTPALDGNAGPANDGFRELFVAADEVMSPDPCRDLPNPLTALTRDLLAKMKGL